MPAGTLQGINISSGSPWPANRGLPVANRSKRAVSYSTASRDYCAAAVLLPVKTCVSATATRPSQRDDAFMCISLPIHRHTGP